MGEALVRAHRGALLEVGAAAEVAGGAANDEHARGRVRRDGAQLQRQLLDRHAAEGVAPLGPVDDEAGDAVELVVEQHLEAYAAVPPITARARSTSGVSIIRPSNSTVARPSSSDQLVGLEQPVAPVKLLVARREDAVRERHLRGMDAQLPTVAEVAAAGRVLEVALVVAHLEHRLVDRGDARQPRGEHDARPAVGHLVRLVGAAGADVGREVLGTEIGGRGACAGGEDRGRLLHARGRLDAEDQRQRRPAGRALEPRQRALTDTIWAADSTFGSTSPSTPGAPPASSTSRSPVKYGESSGLTRT